MNRVIAALILIGVSVAGQRTAIAAPSTYQIRDLGVFASAPFASLLINDNGYIAVGDRLISPDGAGTPLGGWAFDINSSGQSVGISRPGSATQTGFLTSADGVTTSLPLPAYSAATGLNDIGAVVGYAGASSTSAYSAYVIDASGFHDLGVGPWSVASRINNSGQVVGTTETTSSTGSSKAFLFDRGTVTYIAAPNSRGTYGSDINDSGVIVGTFLRTAVPGPGTRNYPFTFEGGSLIQIGAQQNLTGLGVAINDQGWVVGAGNFGGRQVGYLWDGSVARDLNSLVANAGTWRVHYALDINNGGDIVGLADSNGETHYVLLSAVPEPSALLMLAAGGLLMCGQLRRVAVSRH